MGEAEARSYKMPTSIWQQRLGKWAMIGFPLEGRLRGTSQDRRRILAAWVCLLAALLLYGPLAAAAWSSHALACCTGDHCDIPRHHHQNQKLPAPGSAGAMDCGHDLSGMTACSMACCQDQDQPVVTAVVFVLPHPVSALAAIKVTRANDARHSIEIPRAIEPLSPPPRVALAVL